MVNNMQHGRCGYHDRYYSAIGSEQLVEAASSLITIA